MFVFTLLFCIYCFMSACRMCTARCLLFFCVCGTLGTALTPLAPLPLRPLGCELKSLTAGREATTRETGIEEKREGAVEEHGAKINSFIVPSSVFLASLHWRLPHDWSLPPCAGAPWRQCCHYVFRCFCQIDVQILWLHMESHYFSLVLLFSFLSLFCYVWTHKELCRK